MGSDLSPDELLTTTRAVRKRLDLTRPVPRELLVECVEVAIQAPSGSNRQDWHFLFVDEPQRRAELADLYSRSFDVYASTPRSHYDADDPRAKRQDAVHDSARYLSEHLAEVPVLLVPCISGRVPEDRAPTQLQAGFWGSILPAVWNFMLAARARGLGTVWTTRHLAYERRAATILGIPYDRVTQAGLIPIAFTIGAKFRPASRLPTDRVLIWNEW